ncbi:MAG: tRNA (adenosine(37)-N6)-threonylcarbamoyltransferase complex dimerization subunit type 1 TsaB [Cyclobacteriaceae bacterium]|nr:tRNA (adenosine(37)-N6)-threonylcarbamoyltransferase complex dimerization subunit type 1 TsaB [Cyclobacteriaceae bacterium SS2]
MSKILSIESSTRVCSVAIHDDEELIGAQTYHLEHSHSSLLPEVIRQLLLNCNLELKEIDAIATSIGPGSYTGLRIGVSTAKGLAFVSKIPIIGIDTLTIMAEGVETGMLPREILLCPMIDARRMEVYCLVQDIEGKQYWETKPLIVESDSFAEFGEAPILFFGNGAEKCKDILDAPNYYYIDNLHPDARNMGSLAIQKFHYEDFEDLAYLEPNYLKPFRTNKPAVKFKV